MNFEFSEEQDAARASPCFLTEHCPPAARSARGRRYSDDALAKNRRDGLTATVIRGIKGRPLLPELVASEELGRSVAPVPLAHRLFATEAHGRGSRASGAPFAAGEAMERSLFLKAVATQREKPDD